MLHSFLPPPTTRMKRLKAFQRAGLIFNPVAGKGDAEQELATIKALLSPHLHLEVFQTRLDLNPAEQARAAISAGVDVLIASGGDGTISAVAAAVIGTGIPLAVIPRGIANAFAQGLGLPVTIERACIAILQGATRTIGTVQCNGEPMVLLAGIGFEAATVEAADRQLKDQFGMLAYFLAGLGQLQNLKHF